MKAQWVPIAFSFVLNHNDTMQLKKFSQAAQKVLIQCLNLAKKNHNLVVEPEHLALALMNTVELGEFLSKKNIELKALETSLLSLISKLPKGVKEDPSFSKRMIQALSQAEALSVLKGHENIFVSDIFLSLVENRDKYGALGPVIAKYFLEEPKALKKPEASSDVLLSVTTNINSLILDRKLDPVFGRSDEILRLIQVLSRKNRNNPILIGEPGVGRTSIIYGLATMIVEQKIPSRLISKEILSLDVGALVSGTTLRGQFEERMRKVIMELSEQQGRYILFVRDLSLLMGAGGDGASDAANLLKPSLEQGLQMIGLSTPEAYKKRIEADPSFDRYFQPLWIEQPSPLECEKILESLKGKYELFHGVFIEDDAVKAAVELGSRHLFGRVLPELALNILDEACSRHRIVMDQKPESLTNLADRVMKLQVKGEDSAELSETLRKKTADYEKELNLIESMRAVKNELYDLDNRLNSEKSKGDVKKAAKSNKLRQDLLDKLSPVEKELSSIKKRDRFIDPWVKRDDVAEVISQETGIPVKKMLQSEREKLENIEKLLSAHVIGQKEAISAVGNAIRRARAGLKDTKRPIGSFLFLGPTGVGKTELARTLTNFLFDDERAMVRFDMSEFMERHSVARLIGAPPGYHGSEEGGQLTEKIRRKPYSVVLFDEIEKAHADVLNVLLQVLDEGRLTDSKGNLVNFANTVIIMTSNIGADILLKENSSDVREQIMARLLLHLRPELINRIDEITIFNAIDQEGIKEIAELMLKSVTKRMAHEGYKLVIEPNVKSLLVNKGYSREFGARPLKRAIQKYLENPLAMAMIKGGFKKGDEISAKMDGEEIVFVKI